MKGPSVLVPSMIEIAESECHHLLCVVHEVWREAAKGTAECQNQVAELFSALRSSNDMLMSSQCLTFAARPCFRRETSVHS